jgi:hypothetical protein
MLRDGITFFFTKKEDGDGTLSCAADWLQIAEGTVTLSNLKTNRRALVVIEKTNCFLIQPLEGVKYVLGYHGCICDLFVWSMR